MAILKSVVNVNNGNTGWDKTHVMDALETVFANLGFMVVLLHLVFLNH